MITVTVNGRHIGIIVIALVIGLFGRPPTLITEWWTPSSDTSASSVNVHTPAAVFRPVTSLAADSKEDGSHRSGSIFGGRPSLKLENKNNTNAATGADDDEEEKDVERSPRKTTSKSNPKRGINIVVKDYNVTFQDLAVVVITSSSTIDKRLPLLYEAWIKDAPFPVIILTDERNITNVWDERLMIRTSPCSGKINGLICKTKTAFEIMEKEFKGKKWYLRLMDDTLVVLGNVLNLLNRVDPDKPWCVGDKIPIKDANFSYFQGGGGWGLTAPALSMVSNNWPVWNNVILGGGDSPISPGFTAVSPYADDLLWGIFMANLGIPALKLDGWSGATVDMKAGLIPCDDELRKSFCFTQTFPVGTWADGSDAVSVGTCRTNMTGIGIVHMGLEIWGGRDVWVEQIVNVSKAFARSPNDIVANFEDGPLFYWRLCSKSGRTMNAPNEALYAEIYRSTRSKQRLSEEFAVLNKMKRVYIGLCQEPADIIYMFPPSYHNDSMIMDVLRNALDRHRDHLRYHLRPHAFDLVSADKRVQMVYRVGENAYKLAENVCENIGMPGESECIDYAVANMQSKLPRHLHYDNLCLKTKANVIDPNQYQEDVTSPASQDSPSSSSSSSPPNAGSTTYVSSESSAAALSQPVSLLIEQERKDAIKKKAWRISPVQSFDVVVAIITSSDMIDERIPAIEQAWLTASPIDAIIVSDDKGAKKTNPTYKSPVELVDCPAGEEGIACKTGKAMALLAKRYPAKKWYVRVSDTALVVPDNLLYHLQYFSPTVPRCVGDLITTQGISASYLHGGPGWALNQAGLKVIIDKLDSYQKIYSDPKVNVPFPFEPLHSNIDDFYWGVFLQIFGVSISQCGGWSAVPLDVLTAQQSCQTLQRSRHLGRQGFHVGKTTQGLIVAQTSPRIVLDRPAVINMARQPESYTRQGGAWLDDMVEAGPLLQASASTLAAGYEDEPYHYWRLCRMEGGVDVRTSLPKHIVDDILHNANRGATKEPIRLAAQSITARINLCQSAEELVTPVCQTHALDQWSCNILQSLVEYRRDELRKRVPPAYFTISVDNKKNISAAYRIGDDPFSTATRACQAAGFTPVDTISSNGGEEYGTCIFTIESAANAAVPAKLRFDKLCPLQANASKQQRDFPSSSSTDKKQQQQQQHSPTRKGQPQQEEEQQQQASRRRVMMEAEDDFDDDEEKDFGSGLGSSGWTNFHLDQLRSYVMAGHVLLRVTSPSNASVHRTPGNVPLQIQTLFAPVEGELEAVLGRGLENIIDALSEIMLNCFRVDGGPERCISIYQFMYNVWIDQPGKHGLTYWGKDKATGQRIGGTEGSMTFTAIPLNTLNPFAPYCSVPFTQRDLQFGRLQRMAEDNGLLSFPEPVVIPLQIFYRLSPRTGVQEGEMPSNSKKGLGTVIASTMSLIKNLRELSPEQRNVTTLRVYLNGFSAQKTLRWRQWLSKIGEGLQLLDVIIDQNCPSGNMPSYLHMKEQALSLNDNQTIVYLIEDDYLLQPTAIVESVEVFASHNPCIVIPYDGAERYSFRDFNEDDGKITMVAGRRRHWRTTRSTTVTLAIRVGTMRFLDSMGILMNPSDDYFNSGRAVDKGASIILPLPGLAAHVEQTEAFIEPFVALYFDYYAYAKKLKKQAAREGLTYEYINS